MLTVVSSVVVGGGGGSDGTTVRMIVQRNRVPLFVPSFSVVSCHVMSSHVFSALASCPVMSCHVMSSSVPSLLSCVNTCGAWHVLTKRCIHCIALHEMLYRRSVWGPVGVQSMGDGCIYVVSRLTLLVVHPIPAFDTFMPSCLACVVSWVLSCLGHLHLHLRT